jgi:hypothetical protein
MEYILGPDGWTDLSAFSPDDWADWARPEASNQSNAKPQVGYTESQQPKKGKSMEYILGPDGWTDLSAFSPDDWADWARPEASNQSNAKPQVGYTESEQPQVGNTESEQPEYIRKSID